MLNADDAIYSEDTQININRKLSAGIILVCLAFSIYLTNPQYAIAENTVSQQLTSDSITIASKLQAANNVVEQAFNAILDAEKSGANVTRLLSQLNEASNLLAHAEIELRTDNFMSIENNLDSVVSIAQNVYASAEKMRQDVAVLNQANLFYNITLTVAVIIFFVLVLYLFWRWFKKNYIQNLYKAKPEVQIDEA